MSGPKLAPCPDCGHQVSRAANACPNCGRVMRRPNPVRQPPKQYGCCGLLVIVGLLGFIAVIVSATLSGIRHRQQGETTTESAPLPGPVARSGSVVLTPADFGGEWPIRAERLTLNCDPVANPLSGDPLHAITASIDGKTYAVNGTARGDMQSSGFSDFRDLCVPDPARADDLTPEFIEFHQALVDRGLALCR